MDKIFQIVQNHNKEVPFFIVVLFVFFSNNIVFAQKNNMGNLPPEMAILQNTIANDNSTLKVSNDFFNSNVNFILWFMGTKETVNNTLFDDQMYSKKSIIASGRMPNHLLLKTLLKKTINFKSC